MKKFTKTKKEIYNDLIAYFNGKEIKDFDKEMIIQFAENEIKLLEHKANAAKKAAEKKKAEGDALTDKIASVLTDEFRTIADITDEVAEEDENVSVAKVTYRLTQLVQRNIAEKQQITVKDSDDQKARKVQGYRLKN